MHCTESTMYCMESTMHCMEFTKHCTESTMHCTESTLINFSPWRKCPLVPVSPIAFNSFMADQWSCYYSQCHQFSLCQKRTLATGEVHYWSRSRAELWHKGATSGNVQELAEILIDCDQDTLLLRVRQRGPACHTGRPSCFYRKLVTDDPESKELNGTVQLRFMDVE